MRVFIAAGLLASLVFLGCPAAQASIVTFSVAEEDGPAIDSGSLTFDSADPTAGSITFARTFGGDPTMSPPLFSAQTVGPVTISVTRQSGGIEIDASGTGAFLFSDGSTSGGSLSAGGFFFPYDPAEATTTGFGSIGAQSTTGIAGAATNGTTLFGNPLADTSPVPLPDTAVLSGAALVGLGVIGLGMKRLGMKRLSLHRTA